MAVVANCAECRARVRGVFACLTESQLVLLTDFRLTRTYEPGQPILYEGNPPLAVYCVRQGRIKVWRTGRSGEQHVIGTREPGDLIGYRAAIANRPYSATAEPLESSQVCTIPRHRFVDLVNMNSELCQDLLARLAVLSLDTEDQLLERAHDPVRQRVARYLVRLLHDGDDAPRPGDRLTLPFRREDMARLIGTTPETLSRTLHGFAERGVLDVDRQQIRVRDLEVLRRIAR
jgi:CRP/FNR family transcriptional regulator